MVFFVRANPPQLSGIFWQPAGMRVGNESDLQRCWRFKRVGHEVLHLHHTRRLVGSSMSSLCWLVNLSPPIKPDHCHHDDFQIIILNEFCQPWHLLDQQHLKILQDPNPLRYFFAIMNFKLL